MRTGSSAVQRIFNAGSGHCGRISATGADGGGIVQGIWIQLFTQVANRDMEQNHRRLNWNEVQELVLAMKSRMDKYRTVYGVPRGGCIVAALVGGVIVDKPEDADVIVDDLIDSGATYRRYAAYQKPFHTLLTKEHKDKWIVFPWEQNPISDVKENVVRLLQFIGEDVEREGLLRTPERYCEMFQKLTTAPPFNMTVFENEGTDQMVIQQHIPFYSLCEHHLVPFFGEAAVAYLPNKKIVGISKLARTVEYFARRLQNQERLTQQVASYIQEGLQPLGVAVVMKARHLCVEMRGIQKPGTETITSAMLGVFREGAARQEFINLCK